jgi:hypothetical protein
MWFKSNRWFATLFDQDSIYLHFIHISVLAARIDRLSICQHRRSSQKESQQSVIAGSLFWDFDNLEVGMIGFEPTASCSQSRRATKLRYIPLSLNYHNILSLGSIANLLK